jgi:hypothetical protein
MYRGLAFLIVLAAAASAAAEPPAAPAAAAPAGPESAIEAVWSERRITFDYMGFTTAYNCDSVRDKLIELLRLAGARRDLKVTTSGCDLPNFQVSLMVHARLHFFSPALPGAEPQASSLPVVPATAHWVPVKIEPDQPRSIARGDCELVEQFAQQVLHHLAVRNIDSELRCVPHQLPSGEMHLHFEALTGTHTSEEESIANAQHPKKHDDELKSERKPDSTPDSTPKREN